MSHEFASPSILRTPSKSYDGRALSSSPSQRSVLPATPVRVKSETPNESGVRDMPRISIEALANNTRALAEQLRSRKRPREEDTAPPASISYHVPDMERLSRYLTFKQELFPEERLYSKRAATYKPGSIGAEMLDHFDDSDSEDAMPTTQTTILLTPIRSSRKSLRAPATPNEWWLQDERDPLDCLSSQEQTKTLPSYEAPVFSTSGDASLHLTPTPQPSSVHGSNDVATPMPTVAEPDSFYSTVKTRTLF
ncbi:hypothetical protein BKA62DRAFT_170765 [Auriculariales sp. MPI-PUGE-AT-0066]|nr:hypothetical protein BKA62DRAFT_170765 [Auriculariales sp. MPI-PUGE-AT-0066]